MRSFSAGFECVETHSWRVEMSAGPALAPRASHAAAVVHGRLIVIGGCAEADALHGDYGVMALSPAEARDASLPL